MHGRTNLLLLEVEQFVGASDVIGEPLRLESADVANNHLAIHNVMCAEVAQHKYYRIRVNSTMSETRLDTVSASQVHNCRPQANASGQ